MKILRRIIYAAAHSKSKNIFLTLIASQHRATARDSEHVAL